MLEDDEDKLSKAASKAARAQSLLQNELLAEAYAKIEAELISAWINSPPRDNDGRERAWNAVQANRNHRRYLETVVNNGKMAAAELRLVAETTEHKRLFGVRIR